MSDFVPSSRVRANLLQPQKTSDLVTQTQTKVATRKKIDSALDNAMNCLAAQSNARRRISLRRRPN